MCWSLRCSCSITCQCCSNYIFILDLTPGFNGLDKGNCKARQETFKFWNLVWLYLTVVYFSVLSLFPLTSHHVVSWQLSWPNKSRFLPLCLQPSHASSDVDWLLCVDKYALTLLLTHSGHDKMAVISQTTLSNAFSWIKMLEFRYKFHWSLFLRIKLTIFQYWFR